MYDLDMFGLGDYPRHRNTGRGPTVPDHVVNLYCRGAKVGRFTFPATDVRFVKDRDLFRIAFEQIKSRELTADQSDCAYPNQPREGAWDRFEISFYGIVMVGNAKGELVRN